MTMSKTSSEKQHFTLSSDDLWAAAQELLSAPQYETYMVGVGDVEAFRVIPNSPLMPERDPDRLKTARHLAECAVTLASFELHAEIQQQQLVARTSLEERREAMEERLRATAGDPTPGSPTGQYM
jgi:hypothetical protein